MIHPSIDFLFLFLKTDFEAIAKVRAEVAERDDEYLIKKLQRLADGLDSESDENFEMKWCDQTTILERPISVFCNNDSMDENDKKQEEEHRKLKDAQVFGRYSDLKLRSDELQRRFSHLDTFHAKYFKSHQNRLGEQARKRITSIEHC